MRSAHPLLTSLFSGMAQHVRRLFTHFRSSRQSAGSSALKRACLQVESLVGECMAGFCPRKPAAPTRAALVCEQLEVRVVPAATCTWLGTGGNFLASNPANWVGGVAPVAGDSILFPTTSSAPCIIDPTLHRDHCRLHGPVGLRGPHFPRTGSDGHGHPVGGRQFRRHPSGQHAHRPERQRGHRRLDLRGRPAGDGQHDPRQRPHQRHHADHRGQRLSDHSGTDHLPRRPGERRPECHVEHRR